MISFFDLAKTLLLGLGGIGEGTLKISAFFSFVLEDNLLVFVLFVYILLNCKDTLCLKYLSLLAANCCRLKTLELVMRINLIPG